MSYTASADLYWLAGLLEGEGCFATYERQAKCFRKLVDPILQVAMTDKDIVQRAAIILRGRFTISKRPTKGGKIVYRANVSGNRAIGWMMTLFSLMGARRQEKIRECLAIWRNADGDGRRGTWNRGKPLAESTKAKISIKRRLAGGPRDE